jgi:large subunit ribosomal protein L30
MAVKEEPVGKEKGMSPMKKKSTQSQKQDKQLRITLVRSVIGRPQKHREVVKGLGLRKINSNVIRKDCPEIRGMINKISHLLKVEDLEK